MSTETQQTPALELPPDPQDIALGLYEEPAATPEPETPATPEPTPAAAPAPTPPAEDPAVSRAFAKIAERERAQQQKERELRELEARLKPAMEYAELVEKKDKWSLLDRMGVSYDDLTKEYVKGEGLDPQSQIKGELEKTRKALEAQIQEIKQAEQRRFLETQRRDIQQLVQTSESYPHVRAAEAADLVQQTIQSHFHETGELISYDDAAEVVEQSLSQLVDRFMQNPVVKQKYASLFAVASPEKSPRESVREAPRTLRNEDAQERVTLVEKDFDLSSLSEEEQIERLAQQLRYLDD